MEKKNIIIRPTVKQHYMSGINIKSDDLKEDIKISTIYNIEQSNKKVKNAEFSISQMKEFILEIKREMELLLDELDLIKVAMFKSIAVPTGKFGYEDRDSSYGEFEDLSELIERI